LNPKRTDRLTAQRSLRRIEQRLKSGELNANLLLMVSNRLAATKSLEEQMNVIVDIAKEATGSERGSIFLNDSSTGELYARIKHKNFHREVRILNTSGIAGAVFTGAKGFIVADPYNDPRFNQSVDKITGFKTRSILAAPIRTIDGDVIGVVQCLNKIEGEFQEYDLDLLEAMGTQASIVLQNTLYIVKMEQLRDREAEFLDLVADVSSEIKLGPLLQKIMSAVTRMLDSDRSTLFLSDEKTNELFTEVGQGLGAVKIRLPNNAGIAGSVFTAGKTINIPYAYADLRFNPSFDKKTGYFTRSILCVPVNNKEGKRIGVTQVLNKRGGSFTIEDETRLRAFTAQISIGLENAKLFEDVQRMKNYNESILESMSNGVVTIDGNGTIVTCNAAGLRIIGVHSSDIISRKAEDFFSGDDNKWVLEKIEKTLSEQRSDIAMDAELLFGKEKVSVNLTTLPLSGKDESILGSLLLIEDISSEKRVKSTMARYMDPDLADRLLAGGEDALGGKSQEATLLFSDIRGFTTLTEELGAQGTVALLNEYFEIMVECILREGGMLDKFIGDAIMAAFGLPLSHGDDEDRAIRTAISMIVDLQAFNKTRLAHGKKPVEMGVGLNTGMVVSGNIGSKKRMDYTVIGDGVNLAARLESACKTYGARILISQNTLSKLRGTYRTREVDRVIVKGKTKPVAVYEVLDYYNDETFPHLSKVMNLFRDGLALYREQRWDNAISAFTEAVALQPSDKCSKLYIDRCRALKLEPPPSDWSGVWVMKSK
jgi:adenylate cyclase